MTLSNRIFKYSKLHVTYSKRLEFSDAPYFKIFKAPPEFSDGSLLTHKKNLGIFGDGDKII